MEPPNQSRCNKTARMKQESKIFSDHSPEVTKNIQMPIRCREIRSGLLKEDKKHPIRFIVIFCIATGFNLFEFPGVNLQKICHTVTKKAVPYYKKGSLFFFSLFRCLFKNDNRSLVSSHV
jgi:hypothetical protein